MGKPFEWFPHTPSNDQGLPPGWAAYGSRGVYERICRGRRLCRPVGQYDLAKVFRISAVRRAGRTEASAPTGRWIGGNAFGFRSFSFFSSPGAAVLFVLEEEKEKNGGAMQAEEDFRLCRRGDEGIGPYGVRRRAGRSGRNTVWLGKWEASGASFAIEILYF